MNSIGSFGQPSTAAPWGGLPQQAQPWSGGSQWEAASQAPWRMSPFQTQGMPSGQSVAEPPTQGAQLPAGYLPQGTSQSLTDFQPQQAGGGFYPNLLNQPQQQQQAPAPAPQQPMMPQIMSPRTFNAFSGSDTDYATYMGNAIASATPKLGGRGSYAWENAPFTERVRQQGLI